MWRGDISKVTKTFYEGDLKTMANSNVRCTWTDYENSPYKAHINGLEQIYGKQKRVVAGSKVLQGVNG